MPRHVTTGPFTSLKLSHTAIDGQLGAQDEGGLVREQEGHVAGDLRRHAHASDGDISRELVLHASGNFRGEAQLAQDGGLHRSRVNGVDADLARQEVSGEGLGEGVEGTFSGGLDAGGRKPDVDHATAVKHDGRAILEHGEELLDGEVSALDVGVEQLVEVSFVGQLERHEGANTSIDEGTKISESKR